MMGAQAYFISQIESASPVQRVILLYDGAIRFLETAAEQMGRREFESSTLANIRAQNILVELRTALDFKAGGDVAPTLHRYYGRHLRSLAEANLRRDPAVLAEVAASLREMREAWSTVEAGGVGAVAV